MSMNKIKLYGDMAQRFGPEFNVDISDPVEAYRALACQLEGFEQTVRNSSFSLVREMPNGSFAITEEMLHVGMSNTTLHFLPSVQGEGKKGGFKMILGVAIIAASLFIPGSQVFLGMSLQTMGIMTGAALALGGAALLMAPTPKLNTGDADNKDSYLFGGNAGASGQNFAVPVGFGKFRVPGLPVSTQILTDEMYSDQTGLTDRYGDIVTGGGRYNLDSNDYD